VLRQGLRRTEADVRPSFTIGMIVLVCSGCGGAIFDPIASDSGGSSLDAGADVRTASVEASSDVALSMPDADDDSGACVTAPLPTPSGTYVSDPPEIETTTATGFTYLKKLDGYMSGGYDILYTGQSTRWTFEIPMLDPTLSVESALLTVQMVADDHATPIGDYSYELWVGPCVYDSPVALPHGTPPASAFTNWTPVVEYASVTTGSLFTVALSNTGTAGPNDWIGVQWIELEVTLQ
jgi:hypothetical protein